MMRIAILILLTICWSGSFAATLEGAWRSDREKTLHWNSTYRKVNPEQMEKLSLIVGSSALVLEDGKICAFRFPQEYTYRGKKIPIYGGSDGRSEYEVLAENEHGFILHVRKDENESFGLMIFETENSFYFVALDVDEHNQPGYRDYYKRVELPREVNWGNEKCYEPDGT